MTITTTSGAPAASTLRAALGRPSALARLMLAISWREGSRLILDGVDMGPAAALTEIDSEEAYEGRCLVTTVTVVRVAGIEVPLPARWRRVRELGEGRWLISGHTIEIVQPEDAGVPIWH